MQLLSGIMYSDKQSGPLHIDFQVTLRYSRWSKFQILWCCFFWYIRFWAKSFGSGKGAFQLGNEGETDQGASVKYITHSPKISNNHCYFGWHNISNLISSTNTPNPNPWASSISQWREDRNLMFKNFNPITTVKWGKGLGLVLSISNCEKSTDRPHFILLMMEREHTWVI
jgi:hypothetical protein